MDEIEWTGERLVPGASGETVIAHLHRYGVAAQLTSGKRVLDIACGEGYGSKLLAQKAASVVGVDVNAEVVMHAQKKYGDQKLRFIQGAADRIPLGDASIDLVVSFETLEHHDRHSEMLAEIKRVLAPGGVLIISTPDKLHYSEKIDYKNPFHLKELYLEEFQALISSSFEHARLYQQCTSLYSLFMPHASQSFLEYNGDFNSITANSKLSNPQFNIIVASMSETPELGASAFEGREELNALERQHQERVQIVYRSLSYRIGSVFVKTFRLFFPRRK